MAARSGNLTAKQRAFAEAYVLCYNQVQAYHEAFPDASLSTCKAAASRLIHKPEVLEYVQLLQKEQWKIACVNAERIGKELAKIAFNENGDVCYKDQMKALELLQKQLGLQNQKVEVKQEIVEIGLADEDSAT
jgi:phage terminase small subunit